MNSTFNPFHDDNEIHFPSNGVSKSPVITLVNDEIISSTVRKSFIESNTVSVEVEHLSQECIIPVFAKDNERTISHHEFIDTAIQAAQTAIGGVRLERPEIRVSHQIKGRTPDAIHKSVSQLHDHEKTIYYERMAFIVRIPEISENIGGNDLSLTIGGVRSYNLENLYQRKSLEKFKFFIGFQNLVCCNLCVHTDGFKEEMRASDLEQLFNMITAVILQYKAEKHLNTMRKLTQYGITEHQFAQLIGRCRLYQHLPKEHKRQIPSLQFTDGQFNLIAKDYYQDESFSRDDNGEINLWKVYNLFTQANKSSYIDTFLDRNLNALDFSAGIMSALDDRNSNFNWFLS